MYKKRNIILDKTYTFEKAPRINNVYYLQFHHRTMHPGLNLSMQHIPNTEHQSDAPFHPTDQGDLYHPSGGMQLPTGGVGDVVKRPVQEVFVVDLTKINGSFGISLTVCQIFFVVCFSGKKISDFLLSV